MFIDSRSEATRPAQLAVRWRTYFRSEPRPLLLVLLALGLAGLTWGTVPSASCLIALATAGLFRIHLRYVGTRFAGGMLCPGLTLSEKPFLVAVLTDLASNPNHTRPVLKIFEPPTPPRACPTGTRLATVVLYSGQTKAGHWNDCHPALALSANAEETLHDTLLARVPPDEWADLAEACQQLPLPPRCGLQQLQAY